MKIFCSSTLARRCGVAVCLPGAILIACFFASLTEGQDVNLKPTYGSATLKGNGFRPHPYKVDVIAGGMIQTNLGGVNAYVAAAPDFKLTFTAVKNVPLQIYVRSKADTTLLVNLPDGTWVADDDSDGDLNPLLRFKAPQSGRYDIFVGTFGKDTAPATLFISEVPERAFKKDF